MKKLVIGTLTTLAIVIIQSTVVARMLPKDIAARIEACPSFFFKIPSFDCIVA
jgi:hypothetical protein